MAYYWCARENLKSGSKTAKKIAERHERDLSYYDHKIQKWRRLAWEALEVFKTTLENLGDGIQNERYLLNKLTLNPDYRACCYGTVRYGKKRGIVLTMQEIDMRYAKRLNNRKKKKK